MVCFCQGGSVIIMSQKCNLKTYNTLRLILGLENRQIRHPVWLDKAFVIIGFRRIHPSGAIV